MNTFHISGNIIDVRGRRTYPGTIYVEQGRISRIEADEQSYDTCLLPGFIDAHVHVESSMLIPSEFARLAVVHGTVGTISDPHEIANVMGVSGVEYMLENGSRVPFKFNFGAPSCVPATTFETAGAQVSVAEVAALLRRPDIRYLTEMMNFPGVLQKEPEVMAKIAAAQAVGKPVDGHAPGLRGDAARQYIAAGISTDHECFTAEEALDKLAHGMHILIREGSAALNFDALIPLLPEHYNHIMFCSDDKHPDNLVQGHINLLVKRALALGMDLYKVLQAACVNPVTHYKLDVGLLQPGDPADFIVIDNIQDFNILTTYVDGIKVATQGETLISSINEAVVNNFECTPKVPSDFVIPATDGKDMVTIHVMEALDGQLITNSSKMPLSVTDGMLKADVSRDILKIAVVNRYHHAPVAAGFIRNFGLTEGAIASSVAHDSHNIIAVGVDDDSLCKAVNAVISYRGGISAYGSAGLKLLPLPVAGLMSNLDGYTVAAQYSTLDEAAKALGSTLSAPFMTLSFMALLVIPHLKLSDQGLFDGDAFAFTPVIAQ
ncbi:adenine deaminase [Chitinophaga pendula]|uniref:adenine deaminase n=1 Tax=Chitinophaga TaxID=79328 RepID=UPI000BB0B0E0|nr:MULTISPECIES: adenine deaminase [Chitinophaga]ASZ10804.1 adenine deaminase [Chitinophaga sp. MD30]UCJ06217.1 adenine deaminase [Chitinophaga pendula]